MNNYNKQLTKIDRLFNSVQRAYNADRQSCRAVFNDISDTYNRMKQIPNQTNMVFLRAINSIVESAFKNKSPKSFLPRKFAFIRDGLCDHWKIRDWRTVYIKEYTSLRMYHYGRHKEYVRTYTPELSALHSFIICLPAWMSNESHAGLDLRDYDLRYTDLKKMKICIDGDNRTLMNSSQEILFINALKKHYLINSNFFLTAQTGVGQSFVNFFSSRYRKSKTLPDIFSTQDTLQQCISKLNTRMQKNKKGASARTMRMFSIISEQPDPPAHNSSAILGN